MKTMYVNDLSVRDAFSTRPAFVTIAGLIGAASKSWHVADIAAGASRAPKQPNMAANCGGPPRERAGVI